MSLSVLARIQATQVASSQESEQVSDKRAESAKKKQLEAIDAVKDDRVGVIDEKKKQDKKGVIGMIGGLLTGVAVAAAVTFVAVVAVAFSVVTLGAGALMIAGAIGAAVACTAAGQKIGHDIAGKANAVKAELLQRSAAYEEINQSRSADQVKKAEDSAEDAAAAADAAERFAKQIRQHQRELSQAEVGS